MAEKNTRRMRPSELQDDLDSYAGLESLTDYAPANSNYAMAKGTTMKAAMQASQTKEVQDNAEAMASRASTSMAKPGRSTRRSWGRSASSKRGRS